MARRKGSFGGLLVVGLVLFGIAQLGRLPSVDTNSDRRPTSVLVDPSPNATTSASKPSSVAPPALASTEPAQVLETRFVTATSLNVRTAPGTDASVLSGLSRGSAVEVLASEGGWLLINLSGGGKGWISGQYTSGSRPVALAVPPAPGPAPPAPVSGNVMSNDKIIEALIRRSIQNYSGNCPCPYNTTASGRRCGGNSAYSRPGGRSPLCYPSDVTQAMIDAFAR